LTDPRPQANEASSSISGADAHQMHLILALVLLQTIGLFQRERGGPAPENIQQHHAMLVMVSISFFSSAWMVTVCLPTDDSADRPDCARRVMEGTRLERSDAPRGRLEGVGEVRDDQTVRASN
jgi:hypothetical protein